MSELKEKPLSFIASKWIIDRTPHVFQSDRESYLVWKEALAEKIGVDSYGMTFIGSSSTGFSLNPFKNFKPFDDESDIDIAVISHHYFDLSWHFMRNMGSMRYGFTNKQRDLIDDHVSRYIYGGTIATDRILGVLPFGKDWLAAIGDMTKTPPTENREINLRIYMDFESLRAYQVFNLNRIRDSMFSAIAGEKPDEVILRNNT